MWETFISWYINNYLGKYVENLNSQQLSFALRQGELELENVPLKQNIFRSWGLPIQVKSGIIGRIKIEFNILKYFRNEPVLITIEDVYLIAVPLNLAEWDPVQEAALVNEIKMSALDSHEGRWKAQVDLSSNSSSYYSSLYFSSMQIGASIVTKVVENLQLNVRNVHVRFEDKIQNNTVAFGITLRSLTAQSCDSTWNPLSTSTTGNNSDCSFKTLQLTDFGIYCDTSAEHFSDLNPVDLISGASRFFKLGDYLLCPVSAEARISKNNSSHPIASSSAPRFDVQLTLNSVPLQLSDAQFRTTLSSYKSYSRLYRNCRFRHYRPLVHSVKEAPILWWKYAVHSILAFRGYKRREVLNSWADVYEQGKRNVEFVRTYELHLRQEMLSIDQRKFKDGMEANLHYDEIVALREVAMRRVENASKVATTTDNYSHDEFNATQTEVTPPANNVFSYIFPSWSSWLYSANATDASGTSAEVDVSMTALTNEDFENEIIQLRKSESELDESILDDVKSYGRDAVLARFQFVLKKGLITLTRPTGQFLEGDFCDVNISTEIRPRSGAHKLSLSLGSISLRDCCTKSLLMSPHLTSNGKSSLLQGVPIFKLSYERRPHRRPRPSIVHRISLTTKPLDLVVYPVLWKNLASFFAFSDVEQDYLEASENRYEIMKQKTKEELRAYWRRLINSQTNSSISSYDSSWEISLDISAPQIIIHGSELAPTDPLRPNFNRFQYGGDIGISTFVVLDLGRFRFCNERGETDHRRISADSDPTPNLDHEWGDDEDNEEFLTPCSSPVPEKGTRTADVDGDSDSCSSRSTVRDTSYTGWTFSEALDQLQAKLFKKYQLEITDIQIIVVEGKSSKDEGWKIANSLCTSALHLIDRFSINLQLQRRIVYSEDPEWPMLTVMATLPKLNLHFNKSKIQTIQAILLSYLKLRIDDVSLAVEDQMSNSSLNGSLLNLSTTGSETEAGVFQQHRISRQVSTRRSRSRLAHASGPARQLELVIEFDLLNVTVEILKEHDEKLSRIDFLRSKFTFQNYTDGAHDIDLASQEILISDIRDFSSTSTVEKRNIFTNILQLSPNVELMGMPDVTRHSEAQNSQRLKTKLRAEVHFRETQRSSSVTILVNNIRLMLILDFWMEVQKFLWDFIPEPAELLNDEQSRKDNFEIPKRLRNNSARSNRRREVMHPITISAGIVTKRAPVIDVPSKIFEFKLNVSDCELVVVEDTSAWDTNAVILKFTATLTWRPHLERPISCSIIESELFSCVLGIESETALSILDPTNVSIEVVRRPKHDPPGIMDAALTPTDNILEIKTAHVFLRLSYYDMKMFLQIMERFSEDIKDKVMKRRSQPTLLTTTAAAGETILSPTGVSDGRPFHLDEDAMLHLLAMGFPYASCGAALLQCHGRVDEAALLLSSSPTTDFLSTKRLFESRMEHEQITDRSLTNLNELELNATKVDNTENVGVLTAIEVKCTNFLICIIDDCKDADVPLGEFNMSTLEIHQNCIERSLTAEALISIDYYNRELCGLEPLLEPWQCLLNLQQNQRGQLGRQSPTSEFPLKAPEVELSLTSRQVMNLNVTSTLLTLYKTVSANWLSEDGHQDKRRSPFVPFLLKNDTGSTIWFSTIISNPEDVLTQKEKAHADETSCIQVPIGGMQSFTFEGRGKLRHRNTHQLRIHQLIVRVNGWFASRPVSVDRVGTYFRDIIPITNIPAHYGTEMADLPKTRLVFEVSLLGSAKKLVRIRSALMVKNALPETMQLKLENAIIYPAFEMIQTGGGSYCIYVPPLQTCPIPLHSVCSQIWIRPIINATEFRQTTYSYCSKPLPLGRDAEGLRTCTSHMNEQAYRFCVAVKRDEFPADSDEPSKLCNTSLMANNVTIGLAKRANLITILSPLTIVNLLPFEVSFEVKESHGGGTLRGCISAGKNYSVTTMDATEPLEITFNIENFPTGTSLTVSTNSGTFVARVKLLDTQKRPLYLIGKVTRGQGGSITVKVGCQYWIVNKTGLPLMVKQEGVTAEAAGQFQENEHGRMMLPLLFSFADPEAGSNLTMRVGTGLHPPPAKPHWCRSFPLQNGTRVRKLIVGLSNSQPEVVYLTGIEVSDGKGRYRDSKIVTIAPRFIIENRSSRKIQISQRSYATSFHDMAAEATHLTLPPGCTLPFHWPRLDKDQLLCIRLLENNGRIWSGGFPIENVSSFHLNVRDFEGGCYFVRVETVLEGPTYFVVFSDTAHLPPLLRIDNFSLVPVVVHQSNVGDERLKLTVKAESSVAYAWDEPTLPSNMTLIAPGGTSVIARMDESSLGLVAHITYENFFYIALSATFPRNESGGLGVAGMETLQLVLDVPEGSKVVLRKKEAGNRNQLWRVNANGMIEHEGSSPPRDPRKPAPLPSLVLDIGGQATQPTQCVPLMLRKPNRRRSCTQHWEFTRDGRLKCSKLLNVYVQAKDGFEPWHGNGNKETNGRSMVATWQMWNEAVLGPDQPVCYVRTNTGIQAEQAISRQKLRPGSGRISVYVDTDGPTRVLRIIDTEKPPLAFLRYTFEENTINTIPQMGLNLELEGGLGLSLINCNPREELAYIFLSSLTLNVVDTNESQTINLSVENLQIDNQLQESEKSVVVFMKKRTGSLYGIPALVLKWKRLKSQLNAYLFKDWELRVKPLNMVFEEKLLLKMCHWIGIGIPTETVEVADEWLDVQKALTNSSTSPTTKRFYFGQFKIHLKSVRLSLLTSSALPAELTAIKRRLGLTLIRFEDTLVEFADCLKLHLFETFDFLLASILKYYKSELTSQALVVLGSVDFLGNPVGFATDVSEGVTTFISEGTLEPLLRHLTHGISNSAAKVTGSLGDGLTRTLTLDTKHEEWRRTVWERDGPATPLAAGVKGLLIGVSGGLMSVINQTVDGWNDGFTGLVSGLGKGIVGTVTKPAVGVLDLAAGVATAVRDSSRASSRVIPARIRQSRLATGNGGLLPPYSEVSAHGQTLMYQVNGYGTNAVFIGCESISSGFQTFRFLISSERVTVFTEPKRIIILEIPLSELMECRLLEVSSRGIRPLTSSMSPPPAPETVLRRKLVIEFTRAGYSPTSKPQMTVDNEQVAKLIVQQVNYARILYEEMRHSQINQTIITDD